MTSKNKHTRHSDDEAQTHFGSLKIPKAEKAGRVAGVFHAVADNYDLMNDLMSLGTHRVMKQMTIELSRARRGQCILDLAGGTGDLAAGLAPLVGKEGQVYLCDINGSMLRKGRDKLLNRGILNNVSYVQGDGEQLPFPAKTFNAITLAFGLRNMTNIAAALSAMFDCLQPGGRLVILEFSTPENPIIQQLFNVFSRFWPQAGKALLGDSKSYQYLIESIKMHPDQNTLVDMLQDVGFTSVKYHNLINGIAAIHEGVRHEGVRHESARHEDTRSQA